MPIKTAACYLVALSKYSCDNKFVKIIDKAINPAPAEMDNGISHNLKASTLPLALKRADK